MAEKKTKKRKMKVISAFVVCCLILSPFVFGDEGAPSDVVVLTADNFDTQISTGGVWLLEL